MISTYLCMLYIKWKHRTPEIKKNWRSIDWPQPDLYLYHWYLYRHVVYQMNAQHMTTVFHRKVGNSNDLPLHNLSWEWLIQGGGGCKVTLHPIFCFISNERTGQKYSIKWPSWPQLTSNLYLSASLFIQGKQDKSVLNQSL